jgi:signal transduction histidine kinase
MSFTNNELRTLTILEGLSEDLIAWLSENGTRVILNTNDKLFAQGQCAEYMFLIVQGKIERFQEINGQSVVASTTGPGQVTGMLPYSRMTHYPGNAIAAVPSQVLRIEKKNFNPMLNISHEFGQRLVAEMSNRVRGDVRLEQHWEKMVSLGKLSAGLAHELNNPIAAIRSTATGLKEQLKQHTSFIMNQTLGSLDKNCIDAIEQFHKLAENENNPEISPLQRSEEEEKISDWLESRRIENYWKLANIFVTCGISVHDLERIALSIPESQLGVVLTAVSGAIEADRMVSEIGYAAGRVSELVSLVKDYSHMDQSASHKPTDIIEGIDKTLKIFVRKLEQKGITISKQYEQNLPKISGNPGELNQVWTHIIDNAIDAMDEEGHLTIEINYNKQSVNTKIIDNGKGISEDILNRIFDPFFTTKEVGEGTGLGLDIARRIIQTHKGQIDFNSKPGRTECVIRFPIISSNN